MQNQLSTNFDGNGKHTFLEVFDGSMNELERDELITTLLESCDDLAN
jgi:hypothetical protein